jgi:Sigma-70 factor, region 1.2
MKLTRKGRANGSDRKRCCLWPAGILLLLRGLEMPASRQFLGVRSWGAGIVGRRCSDSEQFQYQRQESTVLGGVALRRRFGPWRRADRYDCHLSNIAKVPAGRHGKKVGARVLTNHAAQPEQDLVRLYLNDIGKHPLLTKDDEARPRVANICSAPGLWLLR